MTAEVVNDKKTAKDYYVRHMAPGLARYENPDGTSHTVLVDTDALKKMVPTFRNKPVYVYHQDPKKREVIDPDGWVTDSFYLPEDGWAWVKVLITESAAHDAVGKGWAVSNGYLPGARGAGGTKHNIPYDYEMLDATFTHLALVPDPRYEDAKILTPDEFKTYKAQKTEKLNEIHNSKDPKGAKMFKSIFKPDRKEVTELSGDEMVEFKNSKGEMQTVPLKDMIASVEKEVENRAKKENWNAETPVMIAGKEWKMADVAKYYGEYCNEADDETPEEKEKKKKAKEEADKTEKENSLAREKADKEKADKEKAEGVEHFNSLRSAGPEIVASPVRIEAAGASLARGKDLY